MNRELEAYASDFRAAMKVPAWFVAGRLHLSIGNGAKGPDPSIVVAIFVFVVWFQLLITSAICSGALTYMAGQKRSRWSC